MHKETFHEATQIKLCLLEKYIQTWIPIFLQNKSWRQPKIGIYDFFCGPGTDDVGNPGSPLIILSALKEYCLKSIVERGIQVNVLMNDNDEGKIKELSEKTFPQFFQKCQKDCSIRNCILCPQIEFYNKDFQEIFTGKLAELRGRFPKFLFLDQYGIKEVTKEVFKELIDFPLTDFLFFISSSFLNRFKDEPEFKKYLETEKIEFDPEKPEKCHASVFDYFQGLIPPDKNFYLGRFSIKKGSNYYGLIFGSSHPKGLEKFLDVAWKIDPTHGEANHLVDRVAIHAYTGQQGLFGNEPKTKLEIFENDLTKIIDETGSLSNKDIYFLALSEGISKTKAGESLKSLMELARIREPVDEQGVRTRKNAFYLSYSPQKLIFFQPI